MLSSAPLRLCVLIGAGLLLLYLAVFQLPRWLETPQERLIGTWQEGRRSSMAEVDEMRIRWKAGSSRGTMNYEWVQTKHEPYTLRVIYQGESVEISIRFNGRDEVIAEPRIWDKLPETAQDWIRESNRARKRPAKELRFVFRRNQEEE